MKIPSILSMQLHVTAGLSRKAQLLPTSWKLSTTTFSEIFYRQVITLVRSASLFKLQIKVSFNVTCMLGAIWAVPKNLNTSYVNQKQLNVF